MMSLKDYFKSGRYYPSFQQGGKWYVLRGTSKTLSGAQTIASKYKQKGHSVKIESLVRAVETKVSSTHPHWLIRGTTRVSPTIKEKVFAVYSRK